jgi:hypothetical protein
MTRSGVAQFREAMHAKAQHPQPFPEVPKQATCQMI